MSTGTDTIPALIAEAAARPGVAVVDGSTRIGWTELVDSSRRFAAGLVRCGVEPGDRVAIWAPNGHRWIVAVFGLFQAGATLVPVNTRFKGAEAVDLLARSEAKVLVTTRTFLDTDYAALLEETGADLGALTTVFAEPDEWDDLLAAATDAELTTVSARSAAVTPDDVSDILFTSGTTGVPKGVLMTHARTLCVANDWVAMTGLGPGDRYLMVNPYFHMFGLKAGILAATAAGATMVPMPVFDVDTVVDTVESERITVLPGAPTIYAAILDHPARRGRDLSSLRVAVTGAADIPVELIRRVREELPFDFIVTGYGLSEAGTATATGPDDSAAAVATTVGRPRPGFEVRIADGDEAVAPGEPGEILLRGPSVMVGYLDDPDATAKTLTEDGWLRTGDLGTVDADGYLRIVGRIKDMFIVGGFNAYPAEIENLLLAHPAVTAAAVIGVPDDRLGEVGMAFVVTDSTDPDLSDDIITWSRENMANYKAPRYVEIVDELPVNATGKVSKDELRGRAADLGVGR